MPCFDPSCECCTSWKQLDDQRLEEIQRQRDLAESLASAAQQFLHDRRAFGLGSALSTYYAGRGSCP